jgi:hypothetical protein
VKELGGLEENKARIFSLICCARTHATPYHRSHTHLAGQRRELRR